MLLLELFSDDSGGSMIKDLRQQVMDYLTRLAASKKEFITMQEVMDVLHTARTGLIIDRGLIMSILEPNECKLVKKIEGDKVFLSFPVDEISAKTDQDEEKDKRNVQQTASSMAKKAITK